MFRSWRKQFGLLLIMAMTCVSVVPVAHAASAPNIVTYQGRVLNANGVPVSDTSLNMIFELYDASSGGTCLWSNSSATCATATARSVSLTTGLFTENLGDTGASYAAIPDSLFADNAGVYLQVTIAGETLTPRKQITAAPYALNADTLDGIDSTVLQLFETGSSRTFEDDAPVVVGTNAAFSYGAGDAGDLRIEDTLEVMGDGYIDNDLVVGASTSSTETIANVAFSLSGDDLFVAGDLGVEGAVYIDGALDVVGAITVADLTCTDCLDFTELSDTLALDASTSIAMDGSETFTITNGGTGNILVNLSSTGDFVVQDNGTPFLTLSDSGTLTADGSAIFNSDVDLTFASSENLVISNTSATAEVVDLTSTAAGNDVVEINLTLGDDGDVDTVNALDVVVTSAATGDADVLRGINIETLGSPDGTVGEAGLRIGSGWDVNLRLDDTTAVIGINDNGNLTIQDGSGNSLLSLTDNANTGDLVLTGDVTAQGDNIDSAGAPLVLNATAADEVRIGTGTPGVATDAGDLYVTDGLEVDGALDVAGTASVGDLTCTDCVDFTELSDTLALDASTSITMDGSETFTITNSGSGNVITNLSSTGDFLIQDAGTTIFSMNDSGSVDLNITGDNHVQLTATSAPNNDMLVLTNTGQATTSAGSHAIDITYGVSNAIANVIDVTPSFAGGAVDALTFSILNINDFSPTNSSGTDTVIGLQIGSLTDPGGTIVSNGIRINSGWDVNIFYNDSTTTLRLIDGGSITWQDNSASPNTLMVLNDMGSDGRLQINAINSATASELDLTAGNGSSSAGGAIDMNAGSGSGAGNAGGDISIDAGAGATDGTGGIGGSIALTSGNAGGSGDNNGGNIQMTGGTATGAGQHGNILLSSGGSPTSLSLNGGDIGINAQDDLFFGADDDITFSVTSVSALVSLFDNAVSKTVRIGGVATDAADTINIATEAASADSITIGNAHASTSVSVTGGSVWSVSTAGTATFTFAVASGSNGPFALCHETNGPVTEAIKDCNGAPTADYAEQYPVAHGITYGDIVVPGTRKVTTQQGDTLVELVKSSQAYEGPVVGIVSNNYGDFTSAGYNIAAENNPMPVALVGRVPVKVVSEGGPVVVGDYLAASSTPGAAMKATKAGRVIGMALEDWDGKSATVMVQVNNGWFLGDVLEEDGTSTLMTNNVIVSSVDTASTQEPSFDSYGLALRGSVWNGLQAQAVDMMLKNVVESQDNYRLSVRNTSETEIAYITNEGTMRIAGDMVIGGRLYPSDRGAPQTEKYIYYDGSSGPGGDFMRTNAKGWSTGSYDFAEMFPSSENLVSGDVIAFTKTAETVRRATGASGERLAGVVSTRPGFLAGENVDGSYPIALAGRVPTKVSTVNGSIIVGDPLTASTTAGVAMKASEAGQIIGYALENYTGVESDNFILAYVNVGYWSGDPQIITIVQNQASQTRFDAQSFSALNMSGSIYMATNQILSIGRLEGVSGIWSIESDGTIKTQGELKTVTDSYQGTKVETMAVTSPENVITLTGTTTLVDGQAEVRFEDVIPEFNDVISAIVPIRVIVTPSGPVSLYVSEKDQNHFTVQRFAGSADVEFDWMVTGYRKGFEPKEEVEEVDEVEKVDEVDQVIEKESEAEETLVPLVESDLFNTDQTTSEETIQETDLPVEEAPAPPESPDTTIIDSATQDDGGQEAEPSDVVIETPSTLEP